VRHAAKAGALELEVHLPDPRALLPIVTRVRHVFDLDADPAVIGAHLRGDPRLGPALERHPGLRVPGAWDGFELAVRAVLGQQISVAAATTMAGRVVARFGTAPWPNRRHRLFPSPARLGRARLERVGVVRTRAKAIRELARRAESGRLVLGPGADTGKTMASLAGIPGVGPWTAQYIVMRACGEPDALPTGDLVLRRAVGALSARELERCAEPWRPWRSYAALLLWQEASDRLRKT
jgi:AraC family transcriptional regulator of adaptative response / DNA-3-methyladenine glycosylase II